MFSDVQLCLVDRSKAQQLQPGRKTVCRSGLFLVCQRIYLYGGQQGLIAVKKSTKRGTVLERRERTVFNERRRRTFIAGALDRELLN